MLSLEEAIRYISYYRHHGYTDDQIKNGLIQQGYPYQLIEQAFTPSTKDNHKKTKIFTILTIVILLIGVSIFFYMSKGISTPKKYISPFKTTTTTSITSRGLLLTTTTIKFDYHIDNNPIADEYATDKVQSLNIRNKIKLCYSVNKEKEPYCFLNPYGDYQNGETVYLYFRPLLKTAKKNGIYKIGFTQNRKVYDSFGKIISKFNSKSIDYENVVKSEGIYTVGAYDSINLTNDMSLGEYFIEIKIKYKFSNKSEKLIIPFYLT